MVVRRYLIPIATLAFLGAAPFAILNAILMWPTRPLIQINLAKPLALTLQTLADLDPTLARKAHKTRREALPPSEPKALAWVL
jgi:hypothetical protein